MALNPGDTLNNNHYRILRQLGRGGFGFVYLAQDTLLGEQVAIKELIPALVGDEDTLKRFLAEARATMRLRHERIVATHNVFTEGGNYYIVMECMAGDSLEARLREWGPLPVDEAVRIAAEVCEGLAHAHERGVVHCDLKPHNILFDANGRAKVADFGIAHVSGEMLTRSWKTPQGFVAGTLPYMPPEQAEGVRDDPRIDIYALGAVLYRMLTGRTYLEFDQRETPRAQSDNVQRIYREQPLAPSLHNPAIPAWLDIIILKALGKRPGERYHNADEMRAALLRRKVSAAVLAAVPIAPEQQAPVYASIPTRERSARQDARVVPAARRGTSLPGWFWPAAGTAAVLLVILIVAIGIILGDGHGTKIAVPAHRSTDTPPPTVAPTSTPLNTATSGPTQPPIATPPPTLAPTQTLPDTTAPEPTQPTPQEVQPGAIVQVQGTLGAGLNLRIEPTTRAALAAHAEEGALLVVQDGPVDADGYTWWQVMMEDGTLGWGPADWLVLVPQPS
jgi:serine/threonine protein kinase